MLVSKLLPRLWFSSLLLLLLRGVSLDQTQQMDRILLSPRGSGRSLSIYFNLEFLWPFLAMCHFRFSSDRPISAGALTANVRPAPWRFGRLSDFNREVELKVPNFEAVSWASRCSQGDFVWNLRSVRPQSMAAGVDICKGRRLLAVSSPW